MVAVLAAIAVATGVIALGGHTWIQEQLHVPPDRIELAERIGASLNEQRVAIGLDELQRDRKLESWIEGLYVAGQFPETERILEQLSERDPALLSLSASVIQARNEEELLDEALTGQDAVLKEGTTHLASFVHFKEGGTLQSLVITARRLPRFSPKMLSDNGAEFFNECVLCGEGHTGKIVRANRAVVLTCPHCDRDYDLLAMRVDGSYARVNDLLRAFEPPTAYEMDRVVPDEVIDIWAAVGRHCNYVKDKYTPDGQEDAWQTSRETVQFGNGDCEDTSILLCDWLLSRGIEARVAVGEHREAGGHAWVVARIDGKEHILETTTASAGRHRLPELQSVAKDYYPNFLFDHDGIYFRRRQGWTSEYWSAKEWRRVVHDRNGVVALDKRIASQMTSQPELLEAAFE
ncbi:MAG: transglutaminase-like domain-containing protein [Verrucomicrobiota bacterium]